jgi:hypothetical protein
VLLVQQLHPGVLHLSRVGALRALVVRALRFLTLGIVLTVC